MTAANGPARHHLFEFEDLGWFPELFRNAITDWLGTFTGVYNPVVPLILKLLDHEGSDQVIDLCSGGSGPWAYLKPLLDEASRARGGGRVQLTLTDRYPNVPTFQAVSRRLGEGVGFEAAEVDARNVPERLKGVRTLFTSFHHLRPEDARAVLADAAREGRSIGIFEFVQRDWKVIRDTVWQVPLNMKRTYGAWGPRKRSQLPLVPLIVASSVWDAAVSQIRAYTADDLAALTAGLGSENYRWETGVTHPPGSSDPITYVIGYPVQAA